VHAYYLARKLGIRRIVCPRNAGVASALGLLLAPARVDRTAAFAAAMGDMDWPALEAAYQGLEAAARQVIKDTGKDEARVQRLADMRNMGQGFELVVNLPPGPYNENSGGRLQDAYAQAYQTHFTRPPPNVPLAMAAIRVRLTAPVETAADDPAGGRDRPNARIGRRKAYFPEADGWVETDVLERAAMTAGKTFTGPAVVEEPESTFVIGPGGRFHISAKGNLVVELPEAPS
jgi:N-methylhydantoinase A